MSSDFSDLKLRQLDAALATWRSARLSARPGVGWLKAIREALGMTAAHLAREIGVTTSTMIRLEASEADDAISLSSLRRAAMALDCELVYALVPKTSLADTLQTRAHDLARRQMAAISHSMALEAQSTSQQALEIQIRALTESLLKGSRRKLWRDD